MHPLAVTVTSALSLELGNQNLKNFMGNGLARARELAIGGGINLPRF